MDTKSKSSEQTFEEAMNDLLKCDDDGDGAPLGLSCLTPEFITLVPPIHYAKDEVTFQQLSTTKKS